MIERRNAATLALVLAATLALYGCYLLFRPYVTSIFFACVVAIIFQPVHSRVRRFFPFPNLSAAVSTLLTLLFCFVPLTFLLIAVSNELADLYHSLSNRSGGTRGIIAATLPSLDRITDWVGRRFGLPHVDLQQIALRQLEGLSSSLTRFGAMLVGNAFSFILNSMMATVILFFLYRDGDEAVSRIRMALPFRQDQMTALRTRISSTITATFYGGVAVGALQGTLTGLTFWVLGLESPVLWGVVTAFFSLVPVIGSAAVWVPASIVLLLTGHVLKGILLLVVGALIIGTVDNIVRPLIVRKSVRMHMLLVFFSLLGGLRAFGVLGLFVGPVILSITAALLGMLQQELDAGSRPGTMADSRAKISDAGAA
ncbi:MAG TPA: AI-2E family transporter [Candidatus Angelobacter sp.]|nr:AI-2E family transporter [Candidatus Angelobacter sp.]